MRNILKVASVYICLAMQVITSYAHEESAAKPENTPNNDYFTYEANSEKYELLLKYKPIEKGEMTTLQLYISNYATNAPLDSVQLQITSPDDANLKFEMHEKQKGIYEIETTFPENSNYSLLVNINSLLGPDLLELKNIEPGKQLTVLDQEPKMNKVIVSSNLTWLFGGLILGVLFTWLFMRKRKMQPRIIILMLILLFIPTNSHILTAHNAPEEKAGTNSTSKQFLIQKETQFLFGIITEKLKLENFSPAIKLNGVILPSSNGLATIQSPQTGIIYSLKVIVGQKVEKGQVLAIVEQNIDATSQISLLSQKNEIDAEFSEAKKEYDRLQSIKDIVSKKDLDEVETRYNKAVENRKVFEDLYSGSTDNSKLIYLKSPINGVVDNFNLSIGSTINSGETVFSIVNLDKVYIQVNIFSDKVQEIKSANNFMVRQLSNSPISISAKIISLGTSLSAGNQSRQVILEMNNELGDFKIGEYVNVYAVSSQASNVIAIPNAAINEINGKSIVFVKDNAENYSICYVETGESDDKFTKINHGIEAGERICITNAYEMKMIYLNR